MSVGFTEEQRQFQEVVSRFLADQSPPSAIRQLMETDTGYDVDVWRQLAGEVGLIGTHLPEAYGGFGFGAVEMAIVCREMGRHLYCGPYFSSGVMSAITLLLAADESHKQRLLPEIASGERLAALVIDDVTDPGRLGSSLTYSQECVTGQAKIVVDAHIADTLLVLARAGSQLVLCEVEPAQATIKTLRVMDATRRLCTVTFDEATASLLGEQVEIDPIWDYLNVALANELVGGAERLFETTIDYMKMRVQFGRAIGSFQALKHRCADLLLELEYAKAMAQDAARYLATGEGDEYTPNMAKFLAADAAVNVAKQAIQLRGGIGFTWEEDTHLWFKRAKSSEVFLSTPNWHREKMMQRMEAAHA